MKSVSRDGRDLKISILEHHILSAIIRLRANAYGVTIRQTVSERAGRDLAIGALYTTLDRMEKKGFVSSSMGDPTPERGGRRKKFYKLEAHGALRMRAAPLRRARQRRSEGDLSLAGHGSLPLRHVRSGALSTPQAQPAWPAFAAFGLRFFGLTMWIASP